MKKNFLVVYDYGQGGVWAVITADTPEEIKTRYPELVVYETPPAFISKEQYDRIARNLTLDIGAEPSGWLATLVKGVPSARGRERRLRFTSPRRSSTAWTVLIAGVCTSG